MDEALELELRMLVDKDRIMDVLARYCRGVDRCDADLIASAFHPDAIDEHSYRRLSGTEVGPYLVERMRTMFKATMHCLLQSRIEVDGDVADGETYFVAWLQHGVGVDGAEVIDQAEGRYVDRFDRRHGEWRIAHRVVLPEMAGRFERTTPELLSYVNARPERTRADISYDRVG
jgi:hypothetical protein